VRLLGPEKGLPLPPAPQDKPLHGQLPKSFSSPQALFVPWQQGHLLLSPLPCFALRTPDQQSSFFFNFVF
jgi:hypothetical protein